MATTIQLKRLTSTTLDLCNVVLKVAEPLLGKDAEGHEYIVFGDGTTAVKDLTWEPIGDFAKEVKADGVTIDGTGLDSDELFVKISEADGNILTVESDGLYVAPDAKIFFDEDTIEGLGIESDAYTVRISQDSDNILTIESDGLFVDMYHDIDGGEI